MYKIQQLTSDAQQLQTITLSDGTFISLQLEYKPVQFGWFIVNLTYGDFVINGLRICNNPNILNQFKNKLPFGLACFVVGEREPTLIDDFNSDAAELFILNSDEVKYYSEYLIGKV